MPDRERAEPPQRKTTTSHGGAYPPQADEGPTKIPPIEETRGRETYEGRPPPRGRHAQALPDKARPPHE
ncbi:hypothetical protein SAMN05444365_102308 [Micromonospora pattaloongensis]|uniref:Uncharacterized protein n=1 Tax=Micromonospora pattaloongensis TaxID=405436 RepID=A0A1H3JZ96_9ACTN|nr:hypothetical protein [Micromonospora pattaloongensis]SDY45280.1 hypothetical protein SAMN05444365_102308 [Micromonospora pattaloongensis]